MEVGRLGSKDVRKYGYLRLSGKAVENKIIRLFPSQKNQLDSKFRTKFIKIFQYFLYPLDRVPA